MQNFDPHTNSIPPYLQGLNPPQREAVETLDGPVLMLAGAGTGKTRALTARLAHIVASGRAQPWQILAVTFTNKAAGEMRERISALLGQPVEGWWLGTFHALAARMLRRHAELVGLTSAFTIIDDDDQIRLLKQLMEAEGVDTKKWPPRAVINTISRWKDRARLPSDLSASDAGDIAGGKAVLLYSQYQARLRAVNACDFGDLLMHMVTILRNPQHADLLAYWQRQFRYIMVDEYQDTNVAQYMWLRLLAQREGAAANICCVGDDDQSIYGWRGAEVGNILRFEQDFPNAKIIRLEQNYRSTGHILGAASGVIAHNEDRLGKTLWSDADVGEKVVVRGLWDSPAEARFVGEEIEALQSKGWTLNQIAVLVRAGAQTRAFEERFNFLGVPHRIVGGQRFYERAEVRDALAYLRVIAQPRDDLALERIINVPKRGLGDTTMQRVIAYARASGQCLFDAIATLVETDELKPKPRETFRQLISDFNRWRSLLDTMAHTELTALVLDESGYMKMWQDDTTPEAPGRIENLKELVSGMAEFENLPNFLEHVSLVMENQDRTDTPQVSIMTLHGAKGLEFDAVFLPGWEDGLFPSQRSMDESGLRGLEEERRLAYVGITRARKRAYISHVSNRQMYGSWVNGLPSRFIDELPEEHISVMADSGLHGSGRSSHWDSSGFGGRSAPQPVRSVPLSMARQPQNPTTPAQATQSLDVRKNLSEHPYVRGDRVRHATFGVGTVVNADGAKLDIMFEGGAGHKRVMDSFVTPLE